MGCLGNIIKIVILVFAIIGFRYVMDSDKNTFHLKFFEKPSQEKLQEKASKIADFSNINDEYQIERTANIMGFKAVLVEHKGSNQKMLIVDSGKKGPITKQDFQTKEIDNKIKDLAEKMQYQFIRLEDIKITQRGTINTLGQNVPYIHFTADTVNLPFAEVKGIIGVAQTKDEKTKLIIAFNDSKKYSQIITQQFFKDVK